MIDIDLNTLQFKTVAIIFHIQYTNSVQELKNSQYNPRQGNMTKITKHKTHTIRPTTRRTTQKFNFTKIKFKLILIKAISQINLENDTILTKIDSNPFVGQNVKSQFKP